MAEDGGRIEGWVENDEGCGRVGEKVLTRDNGGEVVEVDVFGGYALEDVE